MTKEEFIQQREWILEERKNLLNKELQLLETYINENKPANIPIGSKVEITIHAHDGFTKIYGFVGGWSVNLNNVIVPILHRENKNGTMNLKRINHITYTLQEYEIKLA